MLSVIIQRLPQIIFSCRCYFNSFWHGTLFANLEMNTLFEYNMNNLIRIRKYIHSRFCIQLSMDLNAFTCIRPDICPLVKQTLYNYIVVCILNEQGKLPAVSGEQYLIIVYWRKSWTFIHSFRPKSPQIRNQRVINISAEFYFKILFE